MSEDRLVSACAVARKVVTEESAALARLADELEPPLARILATLLDATQVIVSGLGKSGNIAQKIAASLTSTGTPAVYMHPVEALHGDLGIVTERHVLLALSRSGNTEELVRFAAHFRRLGGPAFAITQKRESRIVELCQDALILPDLPEAGPHQLAPTTSCIMQLAAGDALAMALLEARGFGPDNFARYHPEGTLGRRLLLRAGDLMHTGAELPLVAEDDSFEHLLVEMTQKGLGLALLHRADGTLLGTFTDGDLRRVINRVDSPRNLTVSEAYARSRRDPSAPPVPVSMIDANTLAVDCLNIMRSSQITSLVVGGADRKPVGLIRLLDLIAAGLA